MPYIDLTPWISGFNALSHTELRTQRNSSVAVSLLNGNPTGNRRSHASGVSARVYRNGSWGFSSAADLSPEAIRSVLDTATDNALFLEKHAPAPSLILPTQTPCAVRPAHTLTPCDQKTYMDFCREVDSYIARTYPDLPGRYVSARHDCMEKNLVTSDGSRIRTVSPRTYINVALTAETADGAPVELFEPYGGFGCFSDRFTDPALLFPAIDRLYEQLMEKREGVYPEAGQKTVILSGLMAGMLAHEAVGHTVEADIVLAGSVAARVMGKTVASPLVSMVDFAHTAFGRQAPLPVYADDEGTPAVDAPLIQQGVLVGYMHSRESAARMGMEAKGNARAYLYSDEPLIRMRNTAVLPGKDKLSDMIASVEDGYYLINTGNGEADTTGEFMFGVTMGYEIRHGKLGRAIRDTTISGIAFEMLKTVDMVSDEITWSDAGYCGKKQPMPVGMGGPALRCQVTMGGR